MNGDVTAALVRETAARLDSVIEEVGGPYPRTVRSERCRLPAMWRSDRGGCQRAGNISSTRFCKWPIVSFRLGIGSGAWPTARSRIPRGLTFPQGNRRVRTCR